MDSSSAVQVGVPLCCTKNEQYPRGDERLDTTVFEEVAGQDTPTILGETVQFLAERYGVDVSGEPVPVC